MAEFAYDRLSFLDNSFLIAETATNHMHVGGVVRFEAGSLRKPDGGIDIDRTRAYVAARLQYIPRYRQVIQIIPVEGRGVWVDDPHFNIHYHVRHTALPRPGDERQLKRLAARIASQQLDRDKPLWEMWVIEGLADPGEFAMVVKIHHCMVDGVSSVDLLTVLLSPQPTEDFDAAPPWQPRPAPDRWALFEAEAVRMIKEPREAASQLREVFRKLEDPTSDAREALRAATRVAKKNLRTVSNTPLNAPIGPHRRFDWLELDLASVKEVKNGLGGSLNDIVLTIVNGAVRRFCERRGVPTEGLTFRVMAPVSIRLPDERGQLGNRVSAWMVDLPVEERDPRRALAAIRTTTDRLREEKHALGAEMLTRAMSWTPSNLLSIASRAALRALPFNLVVTNVPGPQIPFYLLGARMIDNFGMVPLTDYLGLGIVLFSYAGKLCWGLNADWDLLPDLHDIVLDIEASFSELRGAARATEVSTASPHVV